MQRPSTGRGLLQLMTVYCPRLHEFIKILVQIKFATVVFLNENAKKLILKRIISAANTECKVMKSVVLCYLFTGTHFFQLAI